jgi:hypothetical protein
MGQYRKTNQQIQLELDEIHRLWSTGATDEYIMKSRNIKRKLFYLYKKKLVAQLSGQWAAKRMTDYAAEVQICKERLTNDRIFADQKARETGSALWGTLASELAVSILKLEAEGIQAINNGWLRFLEEKARDSRYVEPASPLPPIILEPTKPNESDTATEDPNRVA